MTTVAVIPARYASTRFPGKVLAKDTGKYLVQHVYERVCESKRVDRVVVATDDDRVVEAVTSFGGEVRLTRAGHRSGTDRVGEVAEAMDLDGNDLVLNVQGDEPEIGVEVLDRLIGAMSRRRHCPIGTAATRFDDKGPTEGPGSPVDPNCVKVVVGADGRALYFSRFPIPFLRRTGGAVDAPSRWLLHLGVYAFQADTLQAVTAGRIPPGVLEQAESLEQLRWLEHGFAVMVELVDSPFVGIDTPEDYAAFVARTARSKQGSRGGGPVVIC